MAPMPSLEELDNGPNDPQAALEQAFRAHQDGDLATARNLYQKIETSGRAQNTAKLYLGVLCLQEQDYPGACNYFRQVEGTEADGAMLQVNFGMALMESGNIAEARDHFQIGVNLDPQSPEARYNLGRCLQALGQSGEACEQFSALVQMAPEDGQAWCLYGGALADCGRADDALAALQKTFESTGESALLRYFCGHAWELKKNYTESAANYSRSLDLNPAEMRSALGLARTLPYMGQYEQALHYCSLAEKAAGVNIAVLTTYSAIHLIQRNFAEGLRYARRATELDPQSADACGLLAYALSKTGSTGEADAWFEKARQLDPANPQHALNHSSNYAARGMAQLALNSAHRAFELAPNNPEAFSNVLLYLHYPDSAQQEDIFRLHKMWADLFAVKQQPPVHLMAATDKLRIGFLSGDLRRHSVAFFLRPLLQGLRELDVDVFIYSNNPADDAITEDLKTLSDHWYDIRYMDDDAAYEQISADQLSVLIELNGHTDHNRLQLFSRQPAAVCASWLGYPDTTGINGTYRITDLMADPAGEKEWYTEQLLRLPGCFLCFDGADIEQPIQTATANSDSITFGSFNNISKISDSCIRVWSQILQSVDNSKLLLKSRGLEDPQACERLLELFEQEGVDRHRIELLPATSSYIEHMQLYSRVDIALDTFPYNGTTTTCEALWCGRPVVTLTTGHHRNRVGSSILNACGLSELITADPEQYIQLATGLAGDTEKRTNYHKTIPEQIRKSPLCDRTLFASNFVELLRGQIPANTGNPID